MDKKTLTGLLLIAAILILFSIFGPKSDEDDDTTSNNDKDSTEQIDPVVDSNELAQMGSPLVVKLDENGDVIIDPELGTLHTDTITGLDTFIVVNGQLPEDIVEDEEVDSTEEKVFKPSIEEDIYVLENDVLTIEVSSKGAKINNVFLKKFVSYQDYVDEKVNPLQLFDSTSTFGLIYKSGDAKIRTDGLDFKVVKQSKDAITLETNRKGKTIGFTYTLKEGKYDLDYDIYFKGFSDAEVEEIQFSSDMYLLTTEKYYPNEKRQATIYWQYEGDNYDYITHDSEALDEKTEWVAFRSTFFSAIISAKNGFGSKHSTLNLAEIEDEEQTKYVKQYQADINLGATSATNKVELNWYFGPVDYTELIAYDNGTEDIVELGTGLFRWINKYAIRPLFVGLLNMGMGLGMAILILTIIVKLVLSPVNYKMYKSSAMMKVLKPEIEKITKKFPNKDDAMKKQQATMALYRETGVSPLAGCIPMLIQMPILFAIFRLFPSAIELRQKSFLWAEDLSTYDSPVEFGFDIPLYGDHMSVFTLLMAVTTLIYTHYNSGNMQQPTQAGMPNMKYIMYFFPIMMIFFFNSYSSGLSFYYFISTLMTIGIMFAIKKFFIKEDKILEKIEATKANPKKKGKSKFQQRLADAQKLQQEKTKNKKK